MVILHIASIENYLFSGVRIVVPEYLKAQKRLGHEAALLNLSGERIEGIDQLTIGKERSIDSLPAPFNRPDLVVFQECYCREYLSIWPQLKKKGIPYIIIPHGELGKEAQQKKRLKKAAANLLLFNRFISNALALQCLSQMEYDSTAFGRRKFIGTNGVAVPEERKRAFSTDGAKIVFIGRLDAYHKGLDLMIEAVRLAKPFLAENKCRVEIFGPDYAGRFENVRRLIRENGVQDIVSLDHELLGGEKIKKLLDSDIFIQTSRFEGMPLGILEAMSYALPCLVTEGTALGGEIAASRAGWVAKTEAQDIAERLTQAVCDRSRWEEFGENGRKAILERYSWDAVAADTLKQYESLLALLG